MITTQQAHMIALDVILDGNELGPLPLYNEQQIAQATHFVALLAALIVTVENARPEPRLRIGFDKSLPPFHPANWEAGRVFTKADLEEARQQRREAELIDDARAFGYYGPITVHPTDGPSFQAFKGEAHTKDSDCTVIDDVCIECGTGHGDPCRGILANLGDLCMGRGFHRPGCLFSDEDR